MFIWFLQKKFFLDGRNSHYLTDKLAFSRQKLGADKFYPIFLNTLFFEGFAKPDPARSKETNILLGRIRYLNGGLFLPHHVELDHGFPDQPRILIPDRLRLIDEQLQELLVTHKPDTIATERQLFAANKTTALDVAKALGVVLLASSRHGLPWAE